MSKKMCFSKNINNLINGRNRDKMKYFMKKMMTYKVTINFNMLSALMKYIIASYLDNAPIIIVENGRF